MRISKMKIILILSLVVEAITRDPVRIENGRLTIDSKLPCNITNEGETKEIKPGKIDGYWFGLVYYQCKEEFGYLISKMDCDDCGVYCTNNDYIEGCQNQILQRMVGVVIGMIFSSMTALAIYLGLGKIIKEAWHRVIAYWQSRSDKKANKIADTIEKTTMISATPAYKDKYNLRKHHVRAYKNRRGIAQSPYSISSIRAENIDNPEAPSDSVELKEVETSSSFQVTNDVVTDNYNKNRRASINSNKSLVVAGALLMASMMPKASPCDMNFYLKTNGRICNEQSCYDINMYSFVISYGQSVCFTDTDGEITEYSIENPIERIRYNALYHTGLYKMSTEDTWMCKRNRGCEVGECKIDSIHESFKNYTGINGYGCKSTSSPCDTYCYFSSQCVYYHWNIKPFSKRKTVYEVVSSIWEMTVIMKSKGSIRKAVMNVNNPSVNMEISTLEDKILIPMYITGIDYEKEALPMKGFIVVGEMVMISASENNAPVGGQLGDYQISLDEQTQTIDETMIKCQVENCKSSCIGQEPAIVKIEKGYERYRRSRIQRVMNGGMTVDAIRDIAPTLNIGIGNVNYKNLFVRPARCKISPAMTFGCISCPVKPYVVFESMDVKSEGIVEYESNCTFSRKYLSCSHNPYILEIEDGNKYCWIEVIALNLTMVINIDYKFMGKLTPTRSIVGKEDFRSIVGSIVTSKPFYETVFQTITGCAIVSTVVTVVLKVARLYAVTKVRKEVEVENI